MYYPDQRAASPFTIIRREVKLPDEAVGVVRASEGKRVDVRDIIANGVIPNRYVIIEAAKFFGLKKPEALDDLMLVSPGDFVEDKKVLAGKNPNRGKRLFCPVRGVVAQISEGRIIIQEMPELLDLEAGVRGRITQINQGRGAVIEATGAHIQGIWGNNRRSIATLRMEPEGGLNRAGGNVLEMRFMGAVVFTRSPLTRQSFRIMQEQNFAGIIAPSMDASLRDLAMRAEAVVLLTEGFGDVRMSAATWNMLVEFDGQQATIDAQMPNRWETRHPEVIINVVAREGQRPSRPNVLLSLRTGMNVRVTREPFMGQTGVILDLPKMPTLLDNGLRVPCAQVELVAGETIFVPLANLEVLAR